jgi:predicted transcriptional regulator
LTKALESLGIVMIERKKKNLELIGKIHTAFLETFNIIAKAKAPLTANNIKEKMDINITAANERLSKLITMGLIRREKGTSVAGREQYAYSTVN